MAYRQPRVPQAQPDEDSMTFLQKLVLFLRDFTAAAWAANNRRRREIEEIRRRLDKIEQS